jgi:hypothetical protein
MTVRDNEINKLRIAVYSPEKAGVGGSTPSLATMFSITYIDCLPNTSGAIGCNKFQACRELPQQITARFLERADPKPLSKTPIRDAILRVLKKNPQLWQKALDRFGKPKPARKSARKK